MRYFEFLVTGGVNNLVVVKTNKTLEDCITFLIQKGYDVHSYTELDKSDLEPSDISFTV